MPKYIPISIACLAAIAGLIYLQSSDTKPPAVDIATNPPQRPAPPAAHLSEPGRLVEESSASLTIESRPDAADSARRELGEPFGGGPIDLGPRATELLAEAKRVRTRFEESALLANDLDPMGEADREFLEMEELLDMEEAFDLAELEQDLIQAESTAGMLDAMSVALDNE